MAHSDPHDLPAVLSLFLDAAREAGDIAMASFREGGETTATVHSKLGGSPVTDADFAVDRFLFHRLTAALPQAGWLSEETEDSPERLSKQHVLVIDPIDGTRAFAAGKTSWAVSIGLVMGERPVVGVVYVPALGLMYEAVAGGGAACNGISLSVSTRTDLAGARLAGPENFVAPFAARSGMIFIEKVPSLACRFVRVAEGLFDVGMSSSNAHDWDLAGADLILEEAGGVLSRGDGMKLAYNKAVPRHPPLFGASLALHPALLSIVAPANGKKG